MEAEYVTIFAIKRYAIHDGPDLRTTIFLKGCPLACDWCHNPEGIDFKPKILWLPDKCVGCRECISVCRRNALSMAAAGINRDETRCTLCAECVETCPALAQEATGEKKSIAGLMAEIEKDLPFFDQSGGGVTFSGGEPLSQPEGLLALLQECQKKDIHCTVDTSGYAPTEILFKVAGHANLFLFDLKVMDAARHRRYTGVDNRLILHNLAALARNGNAVRVRIPLIAGVNDDDDNINQLGTFVAELKHVQGIDVLPYHGSARAKYRKLQLHYRGGELKAPDQARIQHVVDTLRHYHADVHIGG